LARRRSFSRDWRDFRKSSREKSRRHCLHARPTLEQSLSALASSKRRGAGAPPAASPSSSCRRFLGRSTSSPARRPRSDHAPGLEGGPALRR
jgi:hypothetical protein